MNETLLNLLQGDERSYPHGLEKRYSRIMDKIIELWDTPEMDAYFMDLMVDSRGGRQGFPQDIAMEIYVLSQAYDRLHPKDESANPWADEDLDKQGEFLRRGYNNTPEGFLKAVENNDQWVVSEFLSRGVDLNVADERGWTALTISSFNGNEAFAKQLIQSGANVNITDTAGYTPMHWAAFNGFASIVHLLIAKHASVNARSRHGWTPLLQAATRGHRAVCSALIAAKADVDLPSNDGWTPLHKACANGHVDVVRLLLSANANRYAKYQDGTTPLQLAEKNKHEKIVALLKE